MVDIVIPTVILNNKLVENIKLYTKKPIEKQRFRQLIDIKYLLRGIDANINFVNKIYLVVADETQVPNWINKDTVNIIYHRDFIPKKYLPTFNSNTIEMFIHNIPNLSEKFIYFNDDIFIINKITEDYFFKNDIPIITSKYSHLQITNVWHVELINNQNLLYNYFKIPTTLVTWRKLHNNQGYLKSIYKECYNIFNKQINKSITKFRTVNNFTGWLFAMYHELTNHSIKNNNSQFKYYSINKINEDLLIKILNDENIKELCLNDNGKINNININFNDIFDKKFPNKSKYEI